MVSPSTSFAKFSFVISNIQFPQFTYLVRTRRPRERRCGAISPEILHYRYAEKWRGATGMRRIEDNETVLHCWQIPAA